MANPEHLKLLKQRATEWNQWRQSDFTLRPDLSDADLSGIRLSFVNLSKTNLEKSDLRDSKLFWADLSDANLAGANLARALLCHANLSGANLKGATFLDANLSGVFLHRINLIDVNLSGANLNEAYLGGDLSRTNLSGANLREVRIAEDKINLCGICLCGADLRNLSSLAGANLSDSDLSKANLCESNLSESDLSRVNLYSANLHKVNLRRANLRETDLSFADLSEANLREAQVLGTQFEKTVLTGACLEDWNINSATKFDNAICEYVYLKADQQERRPREGTFKPGEFAALFQQAVDTVDLIFKDGIDWQAFFQSFQELRGQYADQDLSIQGIEKKRGGAFVVRLEVAEDADKKAIEGSAKELYETKLTLLEQSYRAELQAKDGEIVAYREQSTNLMKITEMLAARPPMSEGNKYDLRGAQFGGGYVAGNVQGDQIGGIINNYGPNTEDITRLLTALRDQAQTFPTDQKDDALDTLEALQDDIAKPEPDQARIGRRLKKLAAIATLITGLTSGAAAVSGDVSTFTGNVIELTEKLGIPVDKVQLPPSGTP